MVVHPIQLAITLPYLFAPRQRCLILYNGYSLPNLETEGGRLIQVLCSFCHSFRGICSVVLTFDKPQNTCLAGSIGLPLCYPKSNFACLRRLSYYTTVKRAFSLIFYLDDCGISVGLVYPKTHKAPNGVFATDRSNFIFTLSACICLMSCFCVLGGLYFIFSCYNFRLFNMSTVLG